MTKDTVQILSQVSGLPKTDIHGIWAEVKANHAKLNACPRHRFSGEKPQIGKRLTCLECGGQMGLTDVGDYIRGYEAAGKSCDDIWPGFRDTRP